MALAGSVAEEYGFEVADVEIGGSLRKPLVRVFIDKPGGVTLDDCERMSRALSARLDVEEPIRGPYTLEVSSPGLDRPLKRTRDFERSIGKRARVITRDQIERQNFFVGKIVEVRDEVVRLALDQEREVLIPIAQISKARLEIEIK